MKNNAVRRTFFGIAAIVAVATAWGNSLVCTIGEAPFAGHSEPIYEDRTKTSGPYNFGPGWSVSAWHSGLQNYDGLATPPDRMGAFALEVNYANDWGQLVLERSVPLNPAGKRALVFRVRGIEDDSLYGQLWVALREPITNNWMELIPVTRYMISTPDGTYDPNEWYTVVIPMDALNPDDLFFNGVIVQTGNLMQVYLDEIWLVQGLEFPLAGYNAATAPISSVFDHTMTGTEPISWNETNGFLPQDGVVTAYTGEVADGAMSPTDSTCVTGADAPYNSVMTNYQGSSECTATNPTNYLSYDGHPGIDWALAVGEPVLAPAGGEILGGTELQCDTATCWGTGKVVIQHPGPYTSVFEHNSKLAPGLAAGSQVKAGDVVAYSGATGTGSPHVHMSVRLWYDPGQPSDKVYVDPYGWSGADPDPYRHRAVNVNLWK